MELEITLEIHAYADEQLCDKYFDNPPFYSINGPEIMEPLSRNRNHHFKIEYYNNSSIGDILNAVACEVWGDRGKPAIGSVTYAFLYAGERYFVNDPSASFCKILNKYIDPNDTGKILVGILVSCNAGAVAYDPPLRYFVNSHEFGKHHEPHVHVRDNGYEHEASIRISDGEIMAGELPSKLAKKARKMVLSNQEFFYNCWNTLTDGLRVDANHHLGCINY